MQFELQSLPYDYDALKPFLSEDTLRTHHTKHHQGYVSKLDKALTDERREQSLTQLVMDSRGKIFNLAAQVWNHDFYWQSMTPSPAKLDPQSRLAVLINDSFGGVDGFFATFSEEAADEFGSGWAWLAYAPESDKLEVFSTTDAVNPLVRGRVPIITLDVWEHAYYLDYRSDRGAYIAEFCDGYLNWEFAEANLARAGEKAAARTA